MRPQEGALQIKFVVLAGLVSVLMGVVPQGALQRALLSPSAGLHSSVLLPTENELKPLRYYRSGLREEESHPQRKFFSSLKGFPCYL